MPMPLDPDVLLLDQERFEALRRSREWTTFDVLVAFHRPQAELVGEDLVEKDGVVSAASIEGELQRLGFQVFIFRSSIEATDTGMRHHLDRGRPLLVRLGRGEEFSWVLAVGYGSSESMVVLCHGTRGVFAMREAEFADLWARGDRIAVLALPRGGGMQ